MFYLVPIYYMTRFLQRSAYCGVGLFWNVLLVSYAMKYKYKNVLN